MRGTRERCPFRVTVKEWLAREGWKEAFSRQAFGQGHLHQIVGRGVRG
ncbi:hypothetical protein SACS_0655 [Parasaccharibacter apium]|uniref:Uncharacterized protein n=1 Tax=Parasaccharibacter apium TaxID=1510841 RepID=A0A7U7G598_9PROT|nr:hypothetical protein SACS_0655 [Parasaccharibacter apium]